MNHKAEAPNQRGDTQCLTGTDRVDPWVSPRCSVQITNLQIRSWQLEHFLHEVGSSFVIPLES